MFVQRFVHTDLAGFQPRRPFLRPNRGLASKGSESQAPHLQQSSDRRQSQQSTAQRSSSTNRPRSITTDTTTDSILHAQLADPGLDRLRSSLALLHCSAADSRANLLYGTHRRQYRQGRT